jgi:sugar/nucleoside kinase (ribokinase family)
MNTYLGASAYFGPADVDADLVRAAQVTFLEGYLFDRPESKEAYWTASGLAHDAGRKVALTLSDLFCVERHHDDFLPLVRERIDILFANESEACALWGCDEVGAAVERARAEVAVACITMSDKGSVVVAGPETYEIPAHPVDVVDTTGAGDTVNGALAAELAAGRPLREAARFAMVAAALSTRAAGAREGMPRRDDVLAAL